MLVNEFYVRLDILSHAWKSMYLPMQLSNAFVSEKSKFKYAKQVKHITAWNI